MNAIIQATICATLKNSRVTFKPDGYLGTSLFQTYRSSLDGAKYDPQQRLFHAALDHALPIFDRLKSAGFTLDVSPELQSALTGYLNQVDTYRATASERADEVDAILKARGLFLYGFQRECVSWLAGRTGAVFALDMGCIDGNATVRISRAGRGFAIKLSELCRKFNGGRSHGGKVWDEAIPTYIRSLCGEDLRLNLIRAVLDKGVKPVVKLTLESGKVLRLTPDHEVRSRDGFVRVDSLRKGDVVLTNGKRVRRPGEDPKLLQHAKRGGKYQDQDGYIRVSGMQGHPRAQPGGFVYEHILVYEKHLGRFIRKDEVVHHRNHNRSDNRLENLELMTISQHMTEHGRKGGFRRLSGTISAKGGLVSFVPKEDRVVSVVPDGIAQVFDVVCDDPHRNFVANGIVVHNCGKTLQSLLASPSARVLVVAPVKIKCVWRDECSKWRPELKPVVLSGRGSFRWPEPGELVITNPDILPEWADGGTFTAPDDVTVIFDEAHAFKSFKSKRTKRAKGLALAVRKAKGRTWALTGTPLLNRPPELYALLELVGEERACFGSWGKFVELFGGYKDQWGGMHWSKEPSVEVPQRLSRSLLRRRRVDVLKDLPGKTVQTIETEIDSTTRKLADALLKSLENAGINLDEAEDLSEASKEARIDITTVSRTREALATAKIPALVDLIEEYEEADEPVVVMSAHKKPVLALSSRPGWAQITGDETDIDVARIMADFQSGSLKGVACTIRAAGVGLTLTRASHMVFCDLDWTPGLNVQAQDRINRIGQTKPCLYRVLVADHIMDRHVALLLQKKQAMVNASVEAAANEAVIPQATDSERALLAAFVTDRTDEQIRRTTGVVAEGVESRYGRCQKCGRAFLHNEVFGKYVDGRSGAQVHEEQCQGKKPRRQSVSSLETWAAHGIQVLAGLDPDGAQELNGKGFNKVDGSAGHSLARVAQAGEGFTDAQWKLVIKLATRYKRQLGPMPEPLSTLFLSKGSR